MYCIHYNVLFFISLNQLTLHIQHHKNVLCFQIFI